MLERVRISLSIVCATIGSLYGACACAAASEEIFRIARPSMTKLAAVNSEGRTFIGTAVALPDGRLVTNCHVTQLAQRVYLMSGDATATAHSQSDDVARDLCVISVPDFKFRPATQRSSSSLKVGEVVVAVGFNHGLGLTYQTGQVTGLFEHDGAYVIQTNAAFAKGASGGGLFDADGRLVGILSFVRVENGRDFFYFALPLEWLGSGAREKPIGPLAGTPFWAETPEKQPLFMRAAQLETDARWVELIAVAREWSARSPADGQAWFSLGKALRNSGDTDAAREAFRRAAEFGVLQSSMP